MRSVLSGLLRAPLLVMQLSTPMSRLPRDRSPLAISQQCRGSATASHPYGSPCASSPGTAFPDAAGRRRPATTQATASGRDVNARRWASRISASIPLGDYRLEVEVFASVSNYVAILR